MQENKGHSSFQVDQVEKYNERLMDKKQHLLQKNSETYFPRHPHNSSFFSMCKMKDRKNGKWPDYVLYLHLQDRLKKGSKDKSEDGVPKTCSPFSWQFLRQRRFLTVADSAFPPSTDERIAKARGHEGDFIFA